jgi:DNA-binding NarL/FixJ family response regulator
MPDTVIRHGSGFSISIVWCRTARPRNWLGALKWDSGFTLIADLSGFCNITLTFMTNNGHAPGQRRVMNEHRPEFANVRLLIGEGNTQMRQGLRSALSAIGFVNGSDTGDLMEIEASLSSGGVDLLICDTAIEDSRINEMTRRVRHQELGSNPFPVMITITDNPTPESIQEIIDSGADGLLAKPVSTGKLVERVLMLAKERKLFVVTSDYIGPTRRKEPRLGTEKIPEIEVPNPVKLKASGTVDSDALRNDIEWNARILDELRLGRCMVQFEYLSDHIRTSFTAAVPEESIPPLANRLWSVAKDMGRRLARSEHTDVVPLCRPVQELAARLGDTSTDPTRQDIAQLPVLIAGIKDALQASQGAAESATTPQPTLAPARSPAAAS